jgi:ABC-type polysaccharide/polyol phosphate export permease
MTVSPAGASAPRPLGTTAGEDLIRGLMNWELYGRLGWLDIKRRYRRTVLGPLWGAITVGIMVATLGSVGIGLWKQDAASYLPFLTSGLIVWVLISTILTESCTIFVFAQNFLRQINFDYSTLAYALIWRNLISFLHNVPLYVIVMLIFAPHHLQPAAALALPGLLLVFLNGAWIALLLGMCCLRFRDIQQLVAALIQVSIFVTPIFWPPDYLSGSFRTVFVTLNPLYHLIEVVRAPLIGLVPPASSYIAVLVMAALGWLGTYALFSAFRRRIAYWS